jgi:tetratricopeptide (TPR) repeat protein
MTNPLKILLVSLIICISIFIFYNLLNKNEKGHLQNISSVKITLPYSFKTAEAESLSIKAFNLKKVGQFDEAIKFYRQAIHIEPGNPKLFFDISECYANIGKLNHAIEDLNSAIVLDSSNAVFYNNRGLYHYQLYEDENAIIDLKKAIQLDRKIPGFYYNLSISYYSANKFSEACNAFGQAKKLGLNIENIINQKELKSLAELCQ